MSTFYCSSANGSPVKKRKKKSKANGTSSSKDFNENDDGGGAASAGGTGTGTDSELDSIDLSEKANRIEGAGGADFHYFCKICECIF